MVDSIIDVSHYNGSSLDFSAAAQGGIQAVIHKATQGSGPIDPMWTTNRAKVLSAGLLFGSYHFGANSDGAAQANHFMAAVGPNTGELLALDFERNDPATMTLDQARAFVTTVHAKIGRWPVLYGGAYLTQMLNGAPDRVLANCPLWLARYGSNAVLPAGWSSWSLWQYNDGKTAPVPPPVPGVGQQVDRERYNGDAIDLATFWSEVSA